MAGEQLGDPGTGSGSVGDLGRGGEGGGSRFGLLQLGFFTNESVEVTF